jgi:hypothetical protein
MISNANYNNSTNGAHHKKLKSLISSKELLMIA